LDLSDATFVECISEKGLQYLIVTQKTTMTTRTCIHSENISVSDKINKKLKRPYLVLEKVANIKVKSKQK
jgi:hypothetical protein